MKNFFAFDELGTNLGRETRAGVTSFLAMAYILFVNPQILGTVIQIDAPNAFGQLLTATALATSCGCLLMGVLARYPFALAPGMGLNAFFAFSVVSGMGIRWQDALGLVFVGGVIIAILTLMGVRSLIAKILPEEIKHAISAGIGMFLAFIGLRNCGLVVAHPETFVSLGNLSSHSVLLAAFGLALTLFFVRFEIKGGFFWGILGSTLLAVLFGLEVYDGGQAFGGFGEGIIQQPAWPRDLFGQLSFDSLDKGRSLGIVLTLVIVGFFDTTGTLIGLSRLSGFSEKVGDLKRLNHAFMADAIASCFAAVVGTTSISSYVESAAGIRDGGRSGFTVIVVAGLFFLSLFLWPLALAVPKAATAPALILIGSMMIANLRHIDWDDLLESFPAFVTVLLTPLSFSIANGVSLGILSFVALKLLRGKFREIHPALYLVASVLLLQFFLTLQ